MDAETKPDITIIYRCTPIESPNKIRPSGLKKLDLVNLCLSSALDAFNFNVNWHILIDKPTYELTDLIEGKFAAYERDSYKIETSNYLDWNGGNIGSFHRQIDIASEIDGKVLLLEDDYYLLPTAGNRICDALEDFQFISIYDHPGYYSESKHLHNATLCKNLFAQHWQAIGSTTLTFGSHGKIIAEYADHMKKFGWADSDMWESIKGHRLWSPVPTLATHMESPWLSPNVDWEKFF